MIGAFSFGGGYAMIPLIQNEIILNHQWLSLQQFLEIIAIAEMTPGPVAINSATYVGYKVAGIPGSVVATLGVIFPSLILILLLARLFRRFQSSSWVSAIIRSIKPAVIGLILTALFILGRPVLVDLKAIIIGIVAFCLLMGERIHPITVIAISAGMGIIFY